MYSLWRNGLILWDLWLIQNDVFPLSFVFPGRNRRLDGRYTVQWWWTTPKLFTECGWNEFGSGIRQSGRVVGWDRIHASRRQIYDHISVGQCGNESHIHCDDDHRGAVHHGETTETRWTSARQGAVRGLLQRFGRIAGASIENKS